VCFCGDLDCPNGISYVAFSFETCLEVAFHIENYNFSNMSTSIHTDLVIPSGHHMLVGRC
jgi:hypothetical protein